MRSAPLLSLALAALALGPSRAEARAPDTFEEMHKEPTVIESPEWYALELKVGPYVPDVGSSAFKTVFNDDRGWLLGGELDVLLYRIPWVGLVGVGAGVGWANYEEGAFDQVSGERVSERTSLTLYPMHALAVLRVDALWRHLGIPLRFAGKLGYDFVRWRAEDGAERKTGLSKGLRWALSAALELSFFEPNAARALDEEWGINHSFLLFEYYGTRAGDAPELEVRDTTFNFGLGFTF